MTQRVTSSLSQWATIRFDPKTPDELGSIARQKGIGPTSLIRLRVMERTHSFHSRQGHRIE